MTDKELRKMTRADFLELLIAQNKEIEDLKTRLANAERQLEEKRINIDTAGTVAEAALKLNGVFDAAQDAASQYLENLAEMNDKQARLVHETENSCLERCRSMIEETRNKCQKMERATKDKCAQLLRSAKAGQFGQM